MVVLVLAAAVAFLVVQNKNQQKKIDELTDAKDQQKLQPVIPKVQKANPDTSPFDKPNVDPLADRFIPASDLPAGMTIIKFDSMEHDFGTIHEGEKVHTSFHFTNKGKVALTINGAQGSCGCTVPNWPKHLIKPGEGDEIYVEFDSKGKLGTQKKTVTVGANTVPQATVLIIKAVVVEKGK